MKYNFDCKLYLVTEESTPTEELLPLIRKAVSGGVTLVQLREKTSDGKAFYEKALQVKRILDTLSIPLIINDRVDVALAVEAAGIHVGQTDLPIEAVKKIIPDSMIVGISAHTEEEALKAEKSGADYIGVGSVFPTSSKPDAKPLPHETLGRIKDSVSIPVVAIGGITDKNVEQLHPYQVDGIAVVSSITRADDPKLAAQLLLKSAFC
ncbi:thiamine-phosphate pyrophosphorylase [Bacillus freudenreichii]|nr:thiamine-phosphate pyrophosphorylase [Bacillus freudenreichii]